MKFLFLFLMILFSSIKAQGNNQVEKSTFIIVYSYLENPWRRGISKSIHDKFVKENISIDIKEITFYGEGLMRKGMDVFRKEAVITADNIAKYNPRAVLLCDDEATDGLMLELMKRKIPTFFTGVNKTLEEVDWWKKEYRDIQTGILEKYPARNGIKVLKQLKPDVKNITILTSNSYSSKIIADGVAKEIKENNLSEKYGISLTSVNIYGKYSEWKRVLPELVKKNDALWILVPYEVMDDNGNEMSTSVIGKYIHDNYKIPTLGIHGNRLKSGQLISFSISSEGLGEQSAQQIIRFLKGQKISEISIEDSMFYSLDVNASEAKRLKLTIPSDFYGFAKFIQ